MALLLRLIGLCAAVIVSGCNSVYFLPMKPWVQNPANQGLEYEDVVLIHPQGQRIHGWWLPAQGKPRGTVYFLHGNAQNVSTHIMNVAWLPGQGFNVLLIDYRGFGLSDGKARLPDAMDDIELGLNWLRASGRLGDRPLVVFGQSLGAGMTIPVLAREQNHGRYDCLISEAAFSGYRAIASDVMAQSWLLWPLRPLVVPFQPRAFDPIDAIADLRAPLLVLHSEDDEVIPYAHGQALFERATAPKEFQRLRGPHIASLRDPAVRGRLLTFMDKGCGAAEVVTRHESAPVRPSEPGSPAQSDSRPLAPARETPRQHTNGFTF